ncbi:MAG: dienelactone hydrolase family protein [Acidobacteria bacterium]|nr:dienelactone hydrolase family protein [Acidobacteriota bacterium]
MNEDNSPIGELVHLYVDGAFGRRELIERVLKITGSMAAAMVALSGYEEMNAQSTPVPPGLRVAENDPDIEARDVTFAGEGSSMFGYFVIPKRARVERQPGVLVIHENRGLVEHIRDVTRRVAKAGYAALGVDLLSRQGGTAQFTDPTQLAAAYNRTNPIDRRADVISSLDFLKRQDNFVIHDRIGVVGFCAGGGVTWDLIVNVPEIAAAAPFYGTPVPSTAEDIAKISTPVLAVYAETDRALTRNMQLTAGLMSTANKTYGLHVYEGVGHAFHNDTGAAYNATAAADAWARTMAHFDKWLRRPR